MRGGLLGAQSLCDSPQPDDCLASSVGLFDRLTDRFVQLLLIGDVLPRAQVVARCRQCLSQLVHDTAKLFGVVGGGRLHSTTVGQGVLRGALPEPFRPRKTCSTVRIAGLSRRVNST